MKLPKIKIPSRKSEPTPRRRLTDRDSLSTESTNRDRLSGTPGRIAFRRNSTITGSRSSAVRSAGELEGQLQSPRTRTHHLRRRQRSLSAMFAVSMLVAVGLVVVIHQFTAGVSVSIYGQISTATYNSQVDYRDIIQQYLNRRPVERVRALLNVSNLTGYMQQSGYSEVEAVESVVPDGFGVTHIKLKVREPVASWTIDGKKRYVDRNGTIFSVNYYPEPSVKIVDQSGVDVDATGSSVTSSRFLAFVGQVVGMLRDSELDVRQVVIPASGTRQVEFVLGNKDTIKMTVDRSAGEQAEDARIAWHYLMGKRQAVRYIDVRVSGQAFYR